MNKTYESDRRKCNPRKFLLDGIVSCVQLARGGSISAVLVMDNCIQYIYAGKQTYYF